MGRKRNIVREFMDYYAGLSNDARKVVRDMLVDSGIAKMPRQPAQQPAATKGAAAGGRSGSSRRRAKDDAITPCANCGQTSVNAIHDKNAGYIGYHEYIRPLTSTARLTRTCGKCGAVESSPAHSDKLTSDYHEFTPANHARNARDQSPPNGAGAGLEASSGTVLDDAGDAHRVVSEGV